MPLALLLAPDVYTVAPFLDPATGPGVVVSRRGDAGKSWTPAAPPVLDAGVSPVGAATVTLGVPAKDGNSLRWGYVIDRKEPIGTWIDATVNAKPTLPADGTPSPEDGVVRSRFYLAPNSFSPEVRSRWLNKEVWPLGGAKEAVWNPVLPATITSVEYLPAEWNVLGGSYGWSSYDGWGSRGFPAQGGLRFHLKLSQPGWTYTGSIGDAGPSWVPALTGPTEVTVDAADEWHFGRMMTVRAPDLTEVAAGVAAAFGKRQIVPGMPRGLVARILGYPRTDADVNEQSKATTWTYPGPTPFSYVVKFDAKGLVESARIAGQLP